MTQQQEVAVPKVPVMDPKELQEAQALVTKAKARLVCTEPFFASILLKRTIKWTASIPTMAVDPRAQIYCNPAFVIKQSVSQLVWALAHECMHIMLMHAQRMGTRQHQKWNVAGDAVINDTLTTAQIGDPIPNTVNMPGSKDKTTETVYAELPDNPGSPGGMGDDLIDGDGGPLSDADASAIEAQIKVDIAQAAQAARMQGKLPAGLDRLVDDILAVKTPWYDILERFMTNMAKTEYSWTHPNRRYISQRLYLPGQSSEAAMGEMLLGIDTSGSISDKELAYFAGHLNRILEMCNPEKVHIVYCDAEVNKVTTVTPDEMPVKLESVGGGGTDLREIFNWADEQALPLQCAVILTDGYTPWPDRVDYPTIVLCTTDTDVPFDVVRFSMDD
jgi:predicted metal-dependent peptidase